MPNGVNQAEVTLNVPAGDQESCDISCNDGANSTIKMSANGGPQWITPVVTSTFDITNSWVSVAGQSDNNCNINGVLGYQLTTCTAGPNACPGPGPFCTQSGSTCFFQRNPVNGHFGGIVRISFLGPLAPASPER